MNSEIYNNKKPSLKTLNLDQLKINEKLKDITSPQKKHKKKSDYKKLTENQIKLFKKKMLSLCPKNINGLVFVSKENVSKRYSLLIDKIKIDYRTKGNKKILYIFNSGELRTTNDKVSVLDFYELMDTFLRDIVDDKIYIFQTL